MMWTIPNILTVLRLLAAPGVAVMFLYFTRPYADWFALLLFVAAAITDWFDGFLARAWKQETKLGTMLDPIADKAMVVIALMIIVGYSSMSPWLVLPATVILFREVFISGLREFLGDTAGTLKVTVLAKWKTTAQMVAISFLFNLKISVSSKCTFPDVGCMRRKLMRPNVVLPQPDSPTSPKISPSWMSNDTLSTALTCPTTLDSSPPYNGKYFFRD